VFKKRKKIGRIQMWWGSWKVRKIETFQLECFGRCRGPILFFDGDRCGPLAQCETKSHL